ncbi:unnamed protein product, partial [Owenia fusiformis]
PYYDRNCTEYYTCRNERMRGNAQQCIFGLVFDSYRQVCVEPRDVCPPCGTGEGLVVQPCDDDTPMNHRLRNPDKYERDLRPEEEDDEQPEGVSLYDIYKNVQIKDLN